MKAKLSDIIAKVRIAIDDIKLDVDDDFYANSDTEIRQALLMAARQIADEAEVDMLEATVITGAILDSAVYGNSDGSGIIVLPEDFMKLQELKFRSWPVGTGVVATPDSEVARKQATKWAQGTPHKPVLVSGRDSYGNKILRYWKAGLLMIDDGEKGTPVYDHKLEYLNYIPNPEIEKSEEGDIISLPVKDEAERYIIYRAAGIYLEGKKEPEWAERMYNLSKA